MDISIFLAKALGTYFLIMFVALMINTRLTKKIVIQTYSEPVLFFLVGVSALIAGILLVICHNIWISDWRVIITLIAWITLLKGTYIVVFPEYPLNKKFKFLHTNTMYYVYTNFLFILGVFLSYHGFYNTVG